MSDRQFDLEDFGVRSTNSNPRFLKTVSLYLSILKGLKTSRASKVASDLKLSKQTVSYYVKRLQVFGIVEKKGYGVWEVKPYDEAIIREVASKQVQRKYPIRSMPDRGGC
jgi:Mn-dependent DtxR family transcriptional regulator